MLLLVLSVLALIIGVAVYPIIRKYPASLSFFDAFVLISIVGLTMMHLIPHSVENAGIPGVIAVSVGFGIPVLLHKFQHHSHHEEHHHEDHKEHSSSSLILLVVIFIGIIIHTILDGIGLSMSSMDGDFGKMLGLGVLFHRLPIGIFLCMMLVPRMGLKKTWGIVLALVTSTCIGFGLGHFALPTASLSILYIIQGLIAGTLLHVVFHNISVNGRNDAKWPKGLGALAGLGTLAIVEWLAPVHAHAHASILDIWVDYLFNAAPVWCIAAIFVACCYALKRFNQTKTVGESLCNWIDPQPLQSAFGGPIHIFSAAGLALLLTIYTPVHASIWFGTAILALVCAKLCLKSLDCCRSCRPESLCSRKKSFSLWTASSWTLIAIATLVASVLPSITSPLTEWIESLPTSFAILIACAVFAAATFAALRHRGITFYSAPLAMFAFLSLFHEMPGAWIFAFALGILLIFLYDFHPRDIATSVEHDHPWKNKYILASVLCVALAFVPAAVIPAISDSAEPIEVTRIEPAHHHHDHEIGESEHAHEIGESEHESVLERDADEMHHDQDVLSGHHAILTRMHQTPVHFASFILFLLCGLFWIMRFGPRHLFEISQGKHHHQHH